MDEELKAALTEHGQQIDKKLEELNKKYMNGEKASNEEIESLKSEIKSYNEKQAEIDKQMNDQFKSMQEQIDKQNIELQKAMKNPVDEAKSLRQVIYDSLNTEEYKAAVSEIGTKKGKFNFSVKAAAPVLESTNLTGEVVPPTRVPGVVYDPTRPEHARDIIKGGQTSSNVVFFTEESGYTDGANVVAEGDASGLTDFTLAESSETVKDIATYLKISKNMLSDLPFLSSYIATRVPAKLKIKEDYQILYGDGTGSNLNGLVTNAAALVPGTFATGSANAVVNPNLGDLLAVAMNQLKVGYYGPTKIVLNPTDLTAYRNKKTSTDKYLADPRFEFRGGLAFFNGIQILETTMLTAGTYLVGDFNLGAQLFDRKQLTLNFYEQDSDNVEKRMVTVELNERLALVTYRSAAFVTGTIATDLAAITHV